MSFRTIDVYANTNPALGSLILWSFCSAFVEKNGEGVEQPLIYFPLPLVLSETYVQTFSGTNSKTGLHAWVERNQELHLSLARDVEVTRQVSRNALLFGIRYGLLELGSEGYVRPGSNFRLSSSRRRQLPDAVREAVALADRFGRWTGDVALTRNVFYALGLSL